MNFNACQSCSRKDTVQTLAGCLGELVTVGRARSDQQWGLALEASQAANYVLKQPDLDPGTRAAIDQSNETMLNTTSQMIAINTELTDTVETTLTEANGIDCSTSEPDTCQPLTHIAAVQPRILALIVEAHKTTNPSA